MSSKAMPIISEKPFVVIFLGLALIVVTIGVARNAGYRPAPPMTSGINVDVRHLQFEDASQGRVLVRDVASGEIIKSFGRGEGSFVRATLRALVHHRMHKGASSEGDFRLERHDGRQLFLIDEATGKTLSLNAYGPDNTAAFAEFMSNQKGVGQ